MPLPTLSNAPSDHTIVIYRSNDDCQQLSQVTRGELIEIFGDLDKSVYLPRLNCSKCGSRGVHAPKARCCA